MDISSLRTSFAKAAAAGDEAPLFFYSHLFLSYPETRRLFPVSMMQQRDRLFRALGDVVAMVDDLDALVPVLQQLGRDHRKFGTLAEHYPAVGASLLATLARFDDDWDVTLERDWAAAYELVASVMVDAAREDSGPAWWDAKVVSHERRTLDVAVLRLQPQAPLAYVAGQSVSVETELRPRLWRYYSLANAPRSDGLLELHVRARDGGPVSSALVRGVGVDDVLHLGPPVGDLTLDPDSGRDLLLLAAGTGLAPLKALIDQLARPEGPPRRADLYVGARTRERLYDLADLRRIERSHPWLTVTPVVSEDRWDDVEHGDVCGVALRHGPWTDRDVYVAGAGVVVHDARARLAQHGVPRERIRTEIFVPSRPGPSAGGGPS